MVGVDPVDRALELAVGFHRFSVHVGDDVELSQPRLVAQTAGPDFGDEHAARFVQSQLVRISGIQSPPPQSDLLAPLFPVLLLFEGKSSGLRPFLGLHRAFGQHRP